MTVRAVLATVDTGSLAAMWEEECAKDPHIAGAPFRVYSELVDVLVSEIDIEPEESYSPPPSVITAVIRFAELAGSAGVALRLLAALSRASTVRWQSEESVAARDLLARTQSVISAWMVLVGSRALNDLDQAAHFDEMTGLFNIRAFRRDLAAALGAPLRPVLVVYADIDGLKHVNDTLGHDAGDAMIKTFAKSLNAACSGPGWRAYRWGGDEHALLLPGASSEQAALVMQRTSESFDSFSWGLASAPDDGDSVSELMKLSDERMYAAKEARRKALWESSRLLKHVVRVERRLTAWRKDLEAQVRQRSS